MLYIIYHDESTVIPKIIVAVNRLAIRVDINKHQDPLYFTFFLPYKTLQKYIVPQCSHFLIFLDRKLFAVSSVTL